MKLYPYQEKAVAHILSHHHCALWLECGLGKTAITIEALRRLPQPVLILAPKRVIDHTWSAEFEKWAPRAKVVSITGTPAQRLAKLRQDAHIHLINFELLPWLVEQTDNRWKTLVIDEASRVKNHGSKLFKTLKKLHFDSVIELTGTPAPNGMIDLWSQLYLLDRGARLGKTITAFRNRWFKSDYMGWSYEPLPHAQAEIEALCADVCLSMTADDYLDLPERLVTDITVDLPPNVRKAYQELKKHLITEVSGSNITAMTAAVLSNKLLQITSGSVYDEDGNVVTTHQTKLEAVEDIIETIGDEPLLVVYQYHHELLLLREKFPHAVEVRDSTDTVDRWNRRDIPLLLLHPASAGHGLNLQYGGRHMVWTTPTWNLEHYQQTNARLHRNGQTKPVMIYRLLAAETIDTKVVDALGKKDALQQALLAALK